MEEKIADGTSEGALMELYESGRHGEFLRLAEERAGDFWLVDYYRHVCYEYGLGTARDPARSERILLDVLPKVRAGVAAGDPRAMNCWAVVLEVGCAAAVPPVAPDPVEAVKWYRRSAELGNANAQCNLAAILREGVLCPRNLEEAFDWYAAAAGQGHGNALYHLAEMNAREEGGQRRDAEFVAASLRKSAQGGFLKAAKVCDVAGQDADSARLLAELLIAIAQDDEEARQRELRALQERLRLERERRERERQERERLERERRERERQERERRGEDGGAPDEAGSWDDGDVCYSFQAPDVDENVRYSFAPPGAGSNVDFVDDEFFGDLPEGGEVPPANGRASTRRTPNLQRTNLSFAAWLVKYVRDRFSGDAPAVYRAAHVSRKTYSAIVGNELRPVSKRTVMAFAFALRLSRSETDEFLKAAGFALSPSILEDMIFTACLTAQIFDLDRVNAVMCAHDVKPFAGAED